MSEERISVRQWQERFRAGAYESKDLKVQCAAGWYDWFCQDQALAGRLKKISRVVMGVTDPYILDNYYVWFKNNCPAVGGLYDDVRFEPLSGDRDGKYFVVSLDSPYESLRWTLFTERYDFGAPEYGCESVRDMVKYINSMAHELEQGIIPAFTVERWAVLKYMQRHDKTVNRPVHRNGEHRFSYTTFPGKQTKNIIVTSDLKDAPPDFVSDQAEQYGGFYLYCPEDAECPAPEQKRSKPARKKEAER
ncbi:hypothetical protein [Intestinimonas butyriciproducens]|uniref:hypothetical protein n=1 Tax=Intestinimonas butyriciproducens TaxID=1297617 RepID=UPI001FB9EB80|nr:hypothetical protein [Intestinimonas butyriciproducens]